MPAVVALTPKPVLCMVYFNTCDEEEHCGFYYRSASLLLLTHQILSHLRVPEDCQRSSYCVKFGPYPSTLQEQHATDNCNVDKPYTVAVYLLVNDLLSLYDPVTGKLLLSFGLPFRNFDLSSSHLDPFWLIFTNAQGLPLENQRGGKWITSFDVSSTKQRTTIAYEQLILRLLLFFLQLVIIMIEYSISNVQPLFCFAAQRGKMSY